VDIVERFSTPVYLDHHATTRVDSRALETLNSCLVTAFGNPHSTSIHGRRARNNLDIASQRVADLIGALPSEICYVAGATEANNLAIQGIARLKDIGRNKILTSRIEHACVLETTKFMEQRYGFQIVEIETDCEGLINLDHLSECLDDKVALVSVMMVNNEIGSIQPISEIAKISHAHGALVHSDAAQALGKVHVDVDDLEVDLLSISAHKMYGPQGIGALFVRENTPIDPIVFGGGQQRFHSGTVPSALCASFGTACEVTSERLAQDQIALKGLQLRLWERLKAGIPDAELNGPQDFADRVPGNLNVFVPDLDSQEFSSLVAPFVSLSAGAACASSKKRFSHVLKALGYSDQRTLSSFRIGIGRENTRFQISYAADKIVEVVNQVRQGIQAAE